MARGRILRVRKKMRDDASIWVSWPKKGSGVPTDLTEDVVRELALPRLTSVETCRVAVLLGVSFGAMFLAMVPMVLDRFGIGQPELWGHASSAMVVYSAVTVRYFFCRRGRFVGRRRRSSIAGCSPGSRSGTSLTRASSL